MTRPGVVKRAEGAPERNQGLRFTWTCMGLMGHDVLCMHVRVGL